MANETTTTSQNRLAFATRCIHAGQEPDPTTGAVMMPIYATSTYVQQSPACTKATNTRAPRTRRAWRSSAASPISKAAAPASPSPRALPAIATMLELLDAGAHVVATDDIYGGTRRLFDAVRNRSAGLEGRAYVDFTDLAARRSGDPARDAADLGRDADQSAAQVVDLARVAALRASSKA